MKRVLVVDDDPEQGADLCRQLRMNLSVDCQVATSLKDGLAFSRSARFHCVVLDLVDGALGAIPEFRCPVVIFTGKDDDPDIRAKCRAAGANNYIQKGTPVETVVERIAGILEVGSPEISREAFQLRAKSIKSERGLLAMCRRNAPVLAVGVGMISLALPNALGVVRTWRNATIEATLDKEIVANLKKGQADEKAERAAGDKSLADSLGDLAKQVKELQDFSKDSKNFERNMEGTVERLSKEFSTMRAEITGAQRRLERNQIQLLIKNGIVPAKDD